MTLVTPVQFEERTYGVQLCLFEVLWAAERRLTHVFGRVFEGEVQLHFTPALAPEQESVCVRLAEEVVSAAFDGQRPRCIFGPAPKEHGWRTLISQEIFVQLAKEVAPWRLQLGR